METETMAGATGEMYVTFPSGRVQLEGLLNVPPQPVAAAVVCHPHPNYGGDMHNGVVCTISTVLEELGYATLRFNFRGVGASSGSYNGGVGEVDDVRAAAALLLKRSQRSHITLAGYSFGAMMALRAGAELATVNRLIAVAPPLMFFDLAFLADCASGKLFVLGDHDQYCDSAELTRQLVSVGPPKSQCLIAGADHFFSGHEHEVAAAVRAFVSSTAQARCV